MKSSEIYRGMCIIRHMLLIGEFYFIFFGVSYHIVLFDCAIAVCLFCEGWLQSIIKSNSISPSQKQYRCRYKWMCVCEEHKCERNKFIYTSRNIIVGLLFAARITSRMWICTRNGLGERDISIWLVIDSGLRSDLHSKLNGIAKCLLLFKKGTSPWLFCR